MSKRAHAPSFLILAALLAMLEGGAALAKAPTELTLTHWWGATAANALEKTLFAAFQAERGIKVKQQNFGWGEYYDKWAVTTAAGTLMGDAILVDAKFAQDMFAAGDHFVDLRPFMRRDKINLRAFSQPALRQFSPRYAQGGPILALPIVSGTIMPYYNKDILSGAGITIPDGGFTWDEFFAVAKKLRLVEGDQVKRYGFGGWHQGILEAMIPAYGARLLTDDRTEPLFHSPLIVQFLATLRELRASNTYGGDFTKGQSAFHFGGDWDPGWWGELPFTWDIMPIPKGPEGHYTTAWANGLAIPKGLSPEKLEAAWELVKFYAMNPMQLGIPDIYLNMMPAYIPTAIIREYVEARPLMNRRLIVEMHSSDHILVELTPNFIKWHDQILGGAFLDAIEGKTPPNTALTQATEMIRGQKLLPQGKP